MKRIISLIIVAAMLVSVSPVFAVSSAEEASICEETGLLAALGVYSQSDAEETGNKAVTRGEFAVYAARLLSLDDEAYVNKRYFKDVPSSRREAGAINALNDRGIMIGVGNYEFDIDEAITPTDAANILLKITGYPKIYLDNKPMPRKRILSGFEGQKTVSKRQLATMIYNMLSLPYLDISGITVDNAQFDVNEDYTVMEALFDVYRIKGRLTAAEGSGIAGMGVTDSSTAVIDNIIYKNAAADAYECIGMYVSAYAKVTDETEGMNTLIYIWADTTDVIEITADRFGSVSGNYQISYLDESGNRVRSVSLLPNVKVLKNGALEKDNVRAALDIKNGSMKLIKNDRGVYDVAIVSVFEAGMITAVDAELKKLYIKGKNPIDLSDDFQRKKIFDENGSEIELSGLRAGQFISYFLSDVSAKIYVSGKLVSGKVEKLSQKSDRVSVVIAGETVLVDSDYYKTNKDKFQTGVSGSFYCDYDGKIAYAVKGGAEGKYAYVLGADIEAMSGVFTLGVYDQSGEFTELKTNGGKLYLDGERVTGQQAYDRLTSNGRAVNRLIRYKTTTDGKLNFIDTAETNNKDTEGETALRKTVDAQSLVYLPTSKSMGVVLPIGANTIVMQIPKENGQVSRNQKDYAINPTFVGYDTYTVDGYTTNPDSIFPDVVVSGLVEVQDSVSCFVFDSIYEVVDSEGEVAKTLKVGGDKGVEHLTISSDFAVSDAERASGYVSWSELSEGDVVRILQNGRGEVTKIGLVLDYDKDTSINTDMLSYYGQYEKWNTENFGFVKKVENGYYKYGERESDAKDEILPLTSNTIVVFDSSKPEDKVYMGSEKDIYSKEDVGANASAILTNQKNGISVFTIVFKNGADLFKGQ